jgi:hypothetical protein
VRVHTIPVPPGHTPESAWERVRATGNDLPGVDPGAPAFDARPPVTWVNVVVDDAGRLLEVR